MCLYPRHIENRKYKPTMKNGGKIPQIPDRRLLSAPVPCGNCIECRKKNYNNWRIRIIEELRTDKTALFVTLTINTESLRELATAAHSKHGEIYGYKLDNAIATIAVRRFLNRIKMHTKKSVKHWLVTELGQEGTEHLHLHGFLWTENKDLVDKWQYGFTWIGNYVTGRTASYVTKYILKTDHTHSEYKPIVLCSPGIGKSYLQSGRATLQRYQKGNTREMYQAANGQKYALPQYYREKIYNEQQRELLWLEKLESEKQYVLGVGVSTRDGGNELLSALATARRKNIRLGYGTNRKRTARNTWENQRREQIQKARLDQGSQNHSTNDTDPIAGKT